MLLTLFFASTTADIIKEYLPRNAGGKMIDFCLFLDPAQSPVARDKNIAAPAISKLRGSLPCGVINHTDFLPLRGRPIAVSIETKKRGGSQQDAELQMATWHAAQWKLLSRLVQDAGRSLDGLSFVPAVLVNGNDWIFAASTREGEKTYLWLERSFGSTSTALGTYSVVWGLQRLARWAEEVYWPWFCRNVLGMSIPTSPQDITAPTGQR